MKCTKCGSEIQEGASFCTVCGMPVMGQTSSMTNNQNDMTSNVQNNTINSSNEVPNLFDNQESGNTQMYTQAQNSSLNYQNSMANNQNNFNGQNNMMNSQPTYNNMANNNQNGKKTPVGLIVGVVVAAIIIIAIFVGISMFKNDDTTNNDTPDTNTQTNVDENNEEQDQTKEDTQTVTYGDYNFIVPADFNATPSTSQLLITSSDNNLAEAIIYQSGTGYDTLASMKDQIISLLQAQESSSSYDFTNAVTTEKTYDGTRFLITSGIKQGTIDLDITYAETDGGVFVVSIAKTGGSINESDREQLYTIVASANQSNF